MKQWFLILANLAGTNLQLKYYIVPIWQVNIKQIIQEIKEKVIEQKQVKTK